MDGNQSEKVATLCRVRDLYRAIGEFADQFAARFGLTLDEGMLLCTLDRRGGQTSGELAAALGLLPSKTSKVIAAVEGRGLVARCVGQSDHRCMHFHLTQAGREALAAVKEADIGLPPALAAAAGLPGA